MVPPHGGAIGLAPVLNTHSQPSLRSISAPGWSGAPAYCCFSRTACSSSCRARARSPGPPIDNVPAERTAATRKGQNVRMSTAQQHASMTPAPGRLSSTGSIGGTAAAQLHSSSVQPAVHPHNPPTCHIAQRPAALGHRGLGLPLGDACRLGLCCLRPLLLCKGVEGPETNKPL